MSVFVTGDTHHDFKRLQDRALAGLTRYPDEGDFLIIAGDFGGIWDGSQDDEETLDWLNSRPFTVLWVDGNHENYDLIAKYPVESWHGGMVQFIRPRVIHLMRGCVYQFEGRRFFVMGGASSHDVQDGILEPDDPDFERRFRALYRRRAMFRVNHVSWWQEELPSEEEYERARRSLADCGNDVDYIITHCAPSSIQELLVGSGSSDELTDFLEEVRISTDFRYWLFGHHHGNCMIDGKYGLLYENIVQLG